MAVCLYSELSFLVCIETFCAWLAADNSQVTLWPASSSKLISCYPGILCWRRVFVVLRVRRSEGRLGGSLKFPCIVLSDPMRDNVEPSCISQRPCSR